MSEFDAEIVGSGPNGLAAAVTLARAGLKVRVIEGASSPGGSARTNLNVLGSDVLTDVGSAVHPMAIASPFFKSFDLPKRIDLRVPDVSYAHPIDGGMAGIAYRSLDETVAHLGAEGDRWHRLFAPLVKQISSLTDVTSGSLFRIARRPDLGIRIGLGFAGQVVRHSMRRADGLTSAMLAGLNAHSIAPLPSLGGTSVGLVLGAHAHANGWPIPVGGSQSISDAMVDDIRGHGGHIELGHTVRSVSELSAQIKIFDVSARGLADIAGGVLPERYVKRLRAFKYGGAASKVDFLLSEPVPWLASPIAAAGTVHLGGAWSSIAQGERDLNRGHYAKDPYVMVSQPSTYDGSRAPAGQHVLWSYTHVPNGSGLDMTDAIVRQIERFAPGFRDTIISSVATPARRIGELNRNHVGGDIATGAVTFDQLLARPSVVGGPWRTPARGIYICSAGTSPGPGVHGMAGWHAAMAALRDVLAIRESPYLGL